MASEDLLVTRYPTSRIRRPRPGQANSAVVNTTWNGTQ